MQLIKITRNQRDAGIVLLALALLTALCKGYIDWFNLTSVAMFYLLAVLCAAYFSSFLVAVFAAILAFLSINYFFIEPQYTFQIASFQSWLLLAIFLIVSFVVSTSIKQLKDARHKAEVAAQQAQFFQQLAESFAQLTHSQALLTVGCRLISKKLACMVAVAQLEPDAGFILLGQSHAGLMQLHEPSLRWAAAFSRMIGIGTNDWPQLNQWVMPFGRFQTPTCVLVIDRPLQGKATLDGLFITLICHQFASAYYKILSQEQAMQSEMRAQEESYKKTLLAALSHDMRTPLTTILGSANALTDTAIDLNPVQKSNLVQSIKAESAFLMKATENILALVKLHSRATQPLHVDWQLPEEIIGAVVSRYQSRVDAKPMQVMLQVTNQFIKADALLLAQALANLIDNAIKWHEGAQPIAIQLYQAEDCMVIAVNNTGKGFPANFMITSFQQPDTQQPSARGFGLGLMIVQEIMVAHQGRLDWQSDSVQGTTVRLHLPITTVAEPQ